MFPGTLPFPAQTALGILGQSAISKSWYLAGGSALALQLGHRQSVDLDFYTPESLLAADIAKEIQQLGPFITTLLEPPHTLLGTFMEVKFSLFRYAYPLLEEPQLFQQIRIASVQDIAAMKLTAVVGRATKRDYVDLYVITQHYSLETQFEWYEKKYGSLGNNLYSIIKSLSYYDDAEADTFPNMQISLTWETVKAFFSSESIRLGKKFLSN